MEHILAEFSEKVQNDLLCILDGLDELVLDNVCDVIVDRTEFLQEKLIEWEKTNANEKTL